MNPAGEGELIARCRRGEAAAWDELFDRHYAAAGRFIFQLGHDFTREDARPTNTFNPRATATVLPALVRDAAGRGCAVQIPRPRARAWPAPSRLDGLP